MSKPVILFTTLLITQIFAHHNDVCNIENTSLLPAGDKLYYVETFFTANWYKAAQYCRHHGMHLVSIETDNQVNELSNLIKSLGYNNSDYGFWTSGSDLAEENKYVWMGNGKTFSLSKSSWIPGEPNHGHNNTEHCIGLWNHNIAQFKLNDFVCSRNLYFICEHVCDSNH